SLHGLQRSLIANMVTGVSEGFSKDLEIVGVGYRAQAQGPDKMEIAVGFSHPVYVQAPPGITFEVPQPTRITVRGFDKQLVGQVAADIRKLRKPEPYKGKGTAQRPRLAVFRSSKHIYVQAIDDIAGHTIASASTMETNLRANATATTDAATQVGKLIGERVKAAGIESMIFDRGGFKYHGRVAAIADGAR